MKNIFISLILVVIPSLSIAQTIIECSYNCESFKLNEEFSSCFENIASDDEIITIREDGFVEIPIIPCLKYNEAFGEAQSTASSPELAPCFMNFLCQEESSIDISPRQELRNYSSSVLIIRSEILSCIRNEKHEKFSVRAVDGMLWTSFDFYNCDA